MNDETHEFHAQNHVGKNRMIRILVPAIIVLAVVAVVGIFTISGYVTAGNLAAGNVSTITPGGNGVMKEFSMDSFVAFANGTSHPQFSVKDITVNKGDTVRIYVNVTRGTHDFNIDELGVHSVTPTDKVTTIDFVADKVGDFVYYCSMPGHRQNGHWGTLHVVDNATNA